MASISKTPAGKWKARVRTQGTSVSKTFTTRTAAITWGKRKEREFESDRAYGYAESRLRKLTLAQVIHEYLEQWRGKDRSVEGRLAWWTGELGDRKVLDVDKRMVREALNKYAQGRAEKRLRDGTTVELQRKRSGASVNRMQATLSAVYQWGRDELDIVTNPCHQVKGRRESRGCERFLTREEVGRLLDACRESTWDRLHLIVLLALNTCARRGELLKLKWSDIDWKHRSVVLLDTKNEENRVLTLSPEMMGELRKFAGIGEALVFCGRRPRSPRSFDLLWHQAVERAGLEGTRFHDLRHTGASLLAQEGATLHEIANVLGHKNLATTRRYAHFTVESKRQLTDRVLGNFLEGNGDE